jgi:ribosomal protein S18 acetylase RimI-like enzyme
MTEVSSDSSRKLLVREMTIDDLPTVFHIGEEVFSAESSPSLYRTWDEYEITTLFNSDTELCLVAEIDDETVGFALGTTIDKPNTAWKYGYLVWLGVSSDIQKYGVGRALFRELKRRMKDQGVRMIIVDTAADNEPGINFFKKQGFDRIEQHVYMSLNLSRKHRDQ